MPAVLKVVVAVNVVSAIALILLVLAAGGGFASDALPEGEGHEIKLVPIQPEETAKPLIAAQLAQHVEIPPEYRTSDQTQAPWRDLPDGSVQFVKSD